MQLEKKWVITIIGFFAVGLTIVSTWYIRGQLKPKRIASTTNHLVSATALQTSEVGILSDRRDDDYQIIGKRNLFTRPKGKGDLRSSKQPGTILFPRPLKTSLPALPPSFMGRGERPGPSPSTELASLAATGIVQLNGKPFVLLEQIQRGETALIQVGDRAFGYTLASIEGDTVILRGQGNVLTLRLGDNKQEKIPEAPKQPETPTPAKAPEEPAKASVPTMTSPPPTMMFSDQMRQRFGGRRRRPPQPTQ